MPTRQSRLVLGQRPASDPVYLAAALSVALPGQASRAGPRSNGQRRCWTTPRTKRGTMPRPLRDTRQLEAVGLLSLSSRYPWLPINLIEMLAEIHQLGINPRDHTPASGSRQFAIPSAKPRPP